MGISVLPDEPHQGCACLGVCVFVYAYKEKSGIQQQHTEDNQVQTIQFRRFLCAVIRGDQKDPL